MTNPWTQFLDLLPKSPRQIGKVISNQGDGTVTVSLLGGGTMMAKTALALHQRKT